MSWPHDVPDVRRGTRNIKDPFDSPGTSWVHMLATGFSHEGRGAGINALNVLLSPPLDASVDKGVKKFDRFLRGCCLNVIADYGKHSSVPYVSGSQYMRLMLSFYRFSRLYERRRSEYIQTSGASERRVLLPKDQ